MDPGHYGCAVATQYALLPDTATVSNFSLGTTSNLLPARQFVLCHTCHQLLRLAMRKTQNVLHDGALTDLSWPIRSWHVPCQCTPLGCNLVSNVSGCGGAIEFGHT
jgi:hypothetical protein